MRNPLAVAMKEAGLKEDEYERFCWLLLDERERFRDALEVIELGDAGHSGRISRRVLNGESVSDNCT